MNLKERLKQFKEKEYDLNKEKYAGLITSQNPHTLVITCSDSRIDVEKMMQADPGEIFHIRNVANIVPRSKEPKEHPDIISALEYAVKVLKVENIVVCGHSNCGGCGAMMQIHDYEETLPYTTEWIKQSVILAESIKERYSDLAEDKQLEMLEKVNVLQQLDNLMTYPFVIEKVVTGELNVLGFYFDFATGIISECKYDKDISEFLQLIVDSKQKALESL
jgi:carbonic anhydrase